MVDDLIGYSTIDLKKAAELGAMEHLAKIKKRLFKTGLKLLNDQTAERRRKLELILAVGKCWSCCVIFLCK